MEQLNGRQTKNSVWSKIVSYLEGFRAATHSMDPEKGREYTHELERSKHDPDFKQGMLDATHPYFPEDD